jgi:hypothetical protein
VDENRVGLSGNKFNQYFPLFKAAKTWNNEFEFQKESNSIRFYAIETTTSQTGIANPMTGKERSK